MNFTVVRKAVEWYNGFPLSMKMFNKEKIEEILIKAGIDADAVTSHSLLILKAARLVEDGSVWGLNVYSFKDGISVVFHNLAAYIDCYGNCYSNENEFLQILSFFTKQLIFKSQGGWQHTLKKLPTDTEVIQIVLNALSRRGQHKAFSAFNDDCSPCQVIEVLQKMKSFFLFFFTLNEKLSKCENQATFTVTSEKFHILFSNLHYYDVDFQDYKNNDYEKLDAINLDNDMINIPYDKIMIHLRLKDCKNSDNLRTLQPETDKQFRFIDSNYRNYCHFIALKIFKYISLKSVQVIKCTKITEFKSLIFWAQIRFKRYDKARKEFKSREMDIKEEYCQLLNLASDPHNKSKKHHFSNGFTAAYHYQKHYEAIADILRNNFNAPSSSYPEPTDTNKKECVTAYLKTLANDMFENGDFDYVKDETHSAFKTELRQSYRFLKYNDMIKGVKYKFVQPSVIKIGKGCLPKDQEDLKKTFISTISPKFNDNS